MSSHIFNLVKGNRRKVNLFHAHRQIARIGFSHSKQNTIGSGVFRYGLHDPITMQVTMNVSLEPLTHTVWMQRNMRQDELVHEYSDTMDLFKPCFVIVLITENVMITTNQDLTTIQTLHCFQIAPSDYHITQMIHRVLWTHHSVPVVYHRLVHLFCRGERAQRTTIGQSELLPRIGVPEMGIAI